MPLSSSCPVSEALLLGVAVLSSRPVRLAAQILPVVPAVLRKGSSRFPLNEHSLTLSYKSVVTCDQIPDYTKAQEWHGWAMPGFPSGQEQRTREEGRARAGVPPVPSGCCWLLTCSSGSVWQCWAGFVPCVGSAVLAIVGLQIPCFSERPHF